MEGFIDPIIINRFNKELATLNTTSMRRGAGSTSLDRRRDIPVECGFPNDDAITAEVLRDLYNRDSLVARIVEVWPKECWQVTPEIYETDDNTIETPFEQAWDQLGSSLVNEPGYHKEEKGSSIWEYLLRADIECGKGRYGGILLGLNDGKDLSEPVEIKALKSSQTQPLPSPNGSATKSSETKHKLTFLRVFDEMMCQISAREPNRTSPRYGHPTEYLVTFDAPEDGQSIGGGVVIGSQRVHWTRIVHIVDNILPNDITGVPRVKPVLNDVLTAQKSRWGSGEMFWNGASPKLSFETHPQLGGDVIINKSRMKDQIENTLRGLQQWWLLSGMSAKQIAPNVVDPKPFIDSCIQSICIKIETPVPVFIGYEVGELAGSMNVEEWRARVKRRQTGFCTSRIVCPFVNRLINIGVLPVPPEGYIVKWPDITGQSQKDKVQIQSMRINIVVAYIKNQLDRFIPPVEFLVRFLDMEQEEAKTLVDMAMKEVKKQELISTVPVVEDKTQPPNGQPKEQTQNTLNADCGTGAGGFKSGNTCAKGDGSGSSGETPKAITSIKEMVNVQAEHFKQALQSGKYGDNGKEMLADDPDMKKFKKNWNKTLKGLEADPTEVTEIQKSIETAYKEYNIPTVPIFIRKLTTEEKAIGENAHWDNGFMVISDDVRGENRYRSEVKTLDSDRKTTVKEAYPDLVAGLIVHELGHKFHDDNPHVMQRARTMTLGGTKEEKKEISARISSYAASHPQELVAEAYAMSKHPDYKSLPKETRDLVTKVLQSNLDD